MKTLDTLAPLVLALLAACGSEAAEGTAAEPAGPSQPEAPAQQEPGEPLPTPEEAAAQAEESIDASNADAELQRLQQELEGG